MYERAINRIRAAILYVGQTLKAEDNDRIFKVCYIGRESDLYVCIGITCQKLVCCSKGQQTASQRRFSKLFRIS